MPYLQFARLWVFLLLPSDCNCCEVLDDTLGIHSLPCTGFSAVEMKRSVETGKREHSCFSVSFVTQTGVYSRDENGLIATI